MKLILPNGVKIDLDNSIPYNEKLKIVEDIVSEWGDYFYKFKNKKTEVCLEVLSNYLCYEKKEKDSDSPQEVGEDNG